MGLTEEERFRFDLTGFLVRPSILTPEECEEIKQQLWTMRNAPESLPPEHRSLPGGPASLLIDHPRVVDVLHEVIGPEIRLEAMGHTWREKGADPNLALHGGGPQQADPIFGYRVQNGRIVAGIVRVIYELNAVGPGDGGTHFLVGSHKANFWPPEEHLSLEEGRRSPFLVSYECPAGSAVFFTENVCHTGPVWKGEHPRVCVLHAYSHYGTRFHNQPPAPEVFASLPPEKQAYFRDVWMMDFHTWPPTPNTFERFVETHRPAEVH